MYEDYKRERRTVDTEAKLMQEKDENRPLDAVMEYKDFAIECYEQTNEVFKFRFTRGLFKGMEYTIDAATLNILPDADDPMEKMLQMEIQIDNRQNWYRKVEEMIYQIASSDILMRIQKYLKVKDKPEGETETKDE